MSMKCGSCIIGLNLRSFNAAIYAVPLKALLRILILYISSFQFRKISRAVSIYDTDDVYRLKWNAGLFHPFQSIFQLSPYSVSRDSVVGKATSYGMDD
jgi:hypothetical protein